MKIILWIISSLTAAMWILYNLAFFDMYFDFVFVLKMRSLRGIELTAVFLGVFAALLQKYSDTVKKPKDKFSAHNGIVLAIFLILPEFLFPILKPPNYKDIYDQWGDDGICIQSTGYDCGPSATATMLQHFGIHKTVKEISPAVFLSTGGTRTFNIVRYLRSSGLKVQIIPVSPMPGKIPTPCIACVRLGDIDGIAHVIVIFEDKGNSFVIGDSLTSRKFEWDKERTYKNYYFDGCVLQVEKK